MKDIRTLFHRALLTAMLLLFLCATPRVCPAIQYPYALPGSLSATLNVNLAKKTNFNNLLLGLNCSWPENQYGSAGYNHADAQRLMVALRPSSLRYPHGVWANFYDWEVDGRRIYDEYSGTYFSAVTKWPNLRYGFPRFTTLHSNLNFDVLFTWNICYDSPAKGVARLRDQDAKGFNTKWIELGNENFWGNQCSLAVNTIEKFVAVAKAHADALHAAKPGLKLSVPVADKHYKKIWNAALQTQNFYDAVSLHVYVMPGTNGVKQVLDAKNEILNEARWVRQIFPGKPIWLSEWAVKSGDDAISVLGMSDVYLGFFEHPELFQICSYFQMNEHCPLILYNRTNHTHAKTSFGAAYEVIRNIFENSEIYESRINSSRITQGVEAVSAKAVIKNGRLAVFAINKTTNSIPLTLNFSGLVYTQGFSHRALVFADVNDFRKNYGLADNPLTSIAPVNGRIMLPPLSLSQIDGLNQGQ